MSYSFPLRRQIFVFLSLFLLSCSVQGGSEKGVAKHVSDKGLRSLAQVLVAEASVHEEKQVDMMQLLRSIPQTSTGASPVQKIDKKRYPTADLQLSNLYERSVELNKKFYLIKDFIKTNNPNCKLIISDLKSVKRSREKINFEYGGRVEKLLDISRGMIVCVNLVYLLDMIHLFVGENSTKFYEEIRKKGLDIKPIFWKNKLVKGYKKSGFRNFNLRLIENNNEIIFEIQFVPCQAFHSLDETHAILEKIREAKNRGEKDGSVRINSLRNKSIMWNNQDWEEAVTGQSCVL